MKSVKELNRELFEEMGITVQEEQKSFRAAKKDGLMDTQPERNINDVLASNFKDKFIKKAF